MSPDEYDDLSHYQDDVCFQCGGEGYVAFCFDECACVDPESGCDDCIRRCDICNPKPKSPDTDALRQILADALEAANSKPDP